MKRSSYFLSFLTVALFLLSVGNVAKADGVVDPKIALGGGGTCPETPTFQVTEFTQAFTGLPTCGILDFQNEIKQDGEGVTLNMLVVNVTSPFGGAISCALAEGSPFNDFTPDGSSPTSCTFFESSNFFSALSDSECEDSEECGNGIGPGGIFGLTFDPNFGKTVDIVLSQSVITPEPTTLLLFGTGLVAFVANKKRLKAAKPSL
jgi:hypothetical protein